MKKNKSIFILLFSVIFMTIGLITFGSSSWTYDTHYPDEQTIDAEGVKTFPVAYSGSTYYSTIDAAFYDHRSGSDNPKASTTATIVIIPTDEIVSNNNLPKTEATFRAINAAKTLTRSVSLGTNKTVTLPYTGTTVWTIDQSKTGTEYGDNTAANMGKNLKNSIVINNNVSLSLPYSSTLSIGAITSQTNSALTTSCVFSSYSQITLKRNASITISGTLNCYGYIKEEYNAQNTTNVYFTGASNKIATLNCLLNIHQTIGGSATTSCRSNTVWPYNIFTVSCINSTMHFNYYTKVEVEADVMVSSSRFQPKTTLMSSSAGLFKYQTTNTVITWYHSQNAYIASGNTLIQKDSSGNVINVLERVSTTSINNKNRKTKIGITGSAIIGEISLTIVVSISTSTYYLPLSYEYQITINEDSSLRNDYRICFLPGSSLTVKKGATLTLNNHTLFLTKRTNGTSILPAVGANNGVQKYPYITTDEDALPEIECEVENAKLYNAGTVYINKGFGGKLYSFEDTFLEGNNSKVIFGSSYINIGASTEKNSSTCPRFYTTTTALSTFGFYQSHAYFKLYDGTNLNYEIPTPGTYVGYRQKVSENPDTYEYGWVANTAVIRYDTNGGNETYPDKAIEISSGGYDITSADLPDTDPTREHYEFDGWYYDEELTNKVTSTSTYNTYVGKILYAKWIPIDYDIVYHCDTFASGDAFEDEVENNNPIKYNAESSFILYPAVSGDYVFDGWYKDSGFTQKLTLVNASVLSSLSSPYQLDLYGRWYPADAQTFRLTYHNSNEDIECAEYEDVLEANLSSVALPDLSGNNGSTSYAKYFDGWYLDSEYNTKYTTYTQIIGDTDLYARWLDKDTVKLCYQTTASIMETRYLPAGYNFVVPSSTYIPLSPSQGYKWGWKIDGGDTSANGNTYFEGDSICLSNTWGDTVNVILVEVPLDYIFTLTCGSNNKINGTIKRGGNTVHTISNATGTQTYAVKTGDVISVSATAASSSYTAGSISSYVGLTLSAGTYVVDGSKAPSITFSNASSSSGCLLPDTLIDMADGTQKEVKDIQPGDLVKVYNHEEGKVDIAPVIFNEKEEIGMRNTVHLFFSNGKNINIVDEHGFFDITTMKYEYITTDNFEEFIGHEFSDENANAIELLDAYLTVEYTEIYSPVSYHALNIVVDGMLSMPGNCTGFINIFSYDRENLQYNQEEMANDIATYGLCTWEDLAEYGVTEDIFNAYAGEYIYIAMGKGILTEERLIYLMERYATKYDDLL